MTAKWIRISGEPRKNIDAQEFAQILLEIAYDIETSRHEQSIDSPDALGSAIEDRGAEA